MQSLDGAPVSRRELESEVERFEKHLSQLRIELASAIGFLASSHHPVIDRLDAERLAVLFGELSKEEAEQGLRKISGLIDGLKSSAVGTHGRGRAGTVDAGQPNGDFT